MLNKPDINKPAFMLFPNAKTLVINNKCTTCERDIIEDEFKDNLSREEYRISGMCQKCQDEIFNE